MDHPIHVHGTYFQVVSLNGQDPPRETWKDTISVPAGQFVDIAFVMKNPGQWMLHCHIIDHEDGGMVTMVEAR
jgi:FtsP/CotA-like multicopper oxidase with cupredoxin domain